MRPLIVSFYTPEYAGEVIEFERCCHDWGFRTDIRQVHSEGSWRKNVGMKPQFLLAMLDEIKGPILWIDIDGRVRGDLDAMSDLAYRYDFGAYFIPWDEMRAVDRPGGSATKNDGVASGTLYCNNNELCREFLQTWATCEKGQYRYGQIVLGEIWHWQRPAKLRTLRLPQAYCKVFDRPWKKGEAGPIEIEHMQASRRLRNKVR